MKRVVFLVLLALSFCACAQNPNSPKTLKGVLLEQLHSTHDKKEWFVPANVAVAGMTADQAKWKDSKGNHSVGELAYHLIYWNKDALAKFKGETPANFNGDNEATFNFDSKKWAETVKELDQVMTDMEKAVEAADDKTVEKWASMIAHVGAHNAYHIGEMIYIRREQGSWNPENGVK